MSEYELEQKIEQLEWQLRQYHEALGEAIQQRDRLCLDAAWGIVTSLSGIVAMLAPIFIADRLGLENWLAWGGVIVAAFALHFWALTKTNAMRMEEIKQLGPLPPWPPR